MRKYKGEELEVGKIYEETGGLFKFLGKNEWDQCEFVEMVFDEDEDGNVISDEPKESDMIRLLNSSDLFFE